VLGGGEEVSHARRNGIMRNRLRTSLFAEKVQRPYIVKARPPATIAVLDLQFEGRDHQPPAVYRDRVEFSCDSSKDVSQTLFYAGFDIPAYRATRLLLGMGIGRLRLNELEMHADG
jgi:hypothetical protein